MIDCEGHQAIAFGAKTCLRFRSQNRHDSLSDHSKVSGSLAMSSPLGDPAQILPKNHPRI